jgi:hypothetical protein
MASESLGAPPRFLRIKRVVLVSAAVLAAVNIWTGCPLLAVWTGSRVVGDTGLSMGAVFVVLLVLAVSVALLTVALTWLSARYDELTGRPAAARRTSPWLRSMRAERNQDVRRRHRLSAVEAVVIVSVVSAVIAFEVWFFFFAGSSLPNSA